MLRIHGFKPNTSKKTVEMFIENQSGEIELESCDYDAETGVAVVAFKNAQGATKLMSLEQLTLGGVQMSITPLRNAYAGLDREACRPRAVRVCGIGRDTSNEFLTLFFGNRRMCGGGDIEELEYDNEQGVAIITYKDPESASRVVKTQPLKLNKTNVEVTLMTPLQCLPVVLGPVEESKVLVTGLSTACTADDLKTFFSMANLCNEIQDVTFGQQPGVAMLKFTNPPDFDSLRVLCITRPLHATMLSVHRVPLSRVVQVHNIGRVSKDMLSMYFDSKKHSGGGKVVHVNVYREHDYACVELEDPTIVNNILARGHHRFEEQTLHVAAYYDDLGPMFSRHNAPASADSIPENIVVSGVNPDILTFIQRSPTSRQFVDRKMADVSAEVGWNSCRDHSVKITCTIRDKTENSPRIAKDWKQTSEETFLQVLNTAFASEDMDVPQEIWTGFMERIEYVKRLDRSRIVVEVKDKECRVSVIGQRNEVENIMRCLNGDCAKLQQGITTTTLTVRNVKEHQRRMLFATGFRLKLQKQFPDLTLTVDVRAHTVSFTGMSTNILTAKAQMLAIFKNMMSTQMDMSEMLINIVMGPIVIKYVVQEFKRRTIRAVLCAAGKNTLGVWAFSQEHLYIAVDVIKRSVDEQKIAADLRAIQPLQTWKTLMYQVHSDHEGLLKVNEYDDGVIVSGAVKPVELACRRIQDFLSQHVSVEEFVFMKRGTTDYITKYMKKEVGDVRKASQRDGIKITAKMDGPYGFAVRGSRAALDRVAHKLQVLADSVKMNQHKVDKLGARTFLSSEDGKRALVGLQSDHKVVIEPVGLCSQESPAEVSRAGNNAGGSTVVSSISLPGGITVEVVRGDLTRFRADGIVNAANERLDHVGGLAKAIVTAGGPEIQSQCHAYVRERGKLEPGQVWVSTPGKLPCKRLIHAVGPIWQGGECNEDSALCEAISACMREAEKLGLSSIAFPALSSGAFGFPLDRCTIFIMKALRHFLERHTHTCVKKVALVDPSEAVINSFHRSFGFVFSSNTETKLDVSDDDSSQNTGYPETLLSPTSPAIRSGSPDIVLKTPEGITLSLCKSEIAQMQVDAIVNSTDCRLQLNRGASSRALLQIGGTSLQTECQMVAPDGIEYGEVVTTGSGQLKCKLVMHGACCSWDSGFGRSQHVLRLFVANSFQAAHLHKLTSIAIPAIGTGTLGFPPETVADVMLDELMKFSRDNPRTTLTDVRFVVYQNGGGGGGGYTHHTGGHMSSPTGKAMSNKRSRSRRRSVSCNRSSASQQEHQGRSVTFNIFARSQAAIKSAVDGLKQLCDKECAEIVLNKKSHQSAIAKLTVGQ
ncbi:Protein mono-ADP-ribosyltransferase PARP14, partial [Lamellibrachia satsuma]